MTDQPDRTLATDPDADEMPAIDYQAAQRVAKSYLRQADDYPWMIHWLHDHGLTMDSPPTEVIRAVGRDWQAWATRSTATDAADAERLRALRGDR